MVYVYFDMDGVCVQYNYCKEKVKSYFKGYYLNGRPLFSIIKVMESLIDLPNTKIKILSMVNFAEQRTEKLKWVKTHLPFIENKNIIVIDRSKIVFLPEEKSLIKAKYIKEECEDKITSVLVEDDHRNLKAAKSLLKNFHPYHVSALID